ncbi:hypothetical protein ACTA71_000226 [Dictyostelium dimigraforme]
MDNKKKILKIITIGDRSVGKLSISRTYMGRKFYQWGNSIPLDFFQKDIIIDNETVTLQLWDTHGNVYKDSKVYYRNADCCLLCFDIHNEESFKNLNYWLKELERNTFGDEKVPFVLLSTKDDITRTEKSISKEKVEGWCKNIEDQGIIDKVHYFETSSKLSKNIVEAYEVIVKIALNQYNIKQKNSLNIVIQPETPPRSICW